MNSENTKSEDKDSTKTYSPSDIIRPPNDINTSTNTSSAVASNTHSSAFGTSSDLQLPQAGSAGTDIPFLGPATVKIEPPDFDNEKVPTVPLASNVCLLLRDTSSGIQADEGESLNSRQFKMPQTPHTHRTWKGIYEVPASRTSQSSTAIPMNFKEATDKASSKFAKFWTSNQLPKISKIRGMASLTRERRRFLFPNSTFSPSYIGSSKEKITRPNVIDMDLENEAGPSNTTSSPSDIIDMDIEHVGGSSKASTVTLPSNTNIIDMDVENIECVGSAVNRKDSPARKSLNISAPSRQDEIVVLDEEVGLQNQNAPLPVTEETKNKCSDDLNNHLMPILECAVCLEYIIPPIYHCQRGHLICSDCKSQLPCCHTCRSPFLQTRNLAMEQVARQLKYPCKYHLTGCIEHHKLEDKFEHENNCMFRAYLCIQHGCEWKGFLPEILAHMSTSHQDMLLYGPRCSLTINLNPAGNISENWFLTAFDEIFRVNFMQNGARTQIFGGVQYYGPKKKSKNFMYTFEVSSESDVCKRVIVYTRTTHNDSKKMSAYYATGDSFFIRPQAAHFFASDHKLKVSLKIVRTK